VNPRRIVDFEAIRRRLGERCFICEMLAGNPEFRHHIVYEDELAVAFLNRYPPLYGYVIVAPRKHKEEVTGDFSPDEYLQLQEVVRRAGEAIRQVVPTERLYILSLGSQQGNRHVHWHLAPLPPGVPFDRQQLAALGADVLDLSAAEFEQLAVRLREALVLVQGGEVSVEDVAAPEERDD
jgi:diadenosine tetraphosphate (Ap4A) HIT family hydrolase